MSIDRELLEMAAKAAGLQILFEDGHFWIGGPAVTEQQVWNPLIDDGDALRLAATLRLQIMPGEHVGDGCTVETQRPGIAGCTAFYDDKAEQMRRAITIAAAEIGKTKP